MGWCIRSTAVLLIVFVVGFTACAAPSRGTATEDGTAPQQPSTPKRIVVVAQDDPPVLARRATTANSPGLDGIENLYNPGLSGLDRQGRPVPILVEDVPTIANGLWKVLPDGRMETHWRLRPGVSWHDGTPMTAQDVLFSYQIDADPDLPFTSPSSARGLVAAVEAIDDRTVVFHWKAPFIDADITFQGAALPRHLLESAYRDDRAGFANLAYWGQPPVGVGPYQVREWVRGSHIIMQANDRYVHGRPKIDTIEVKLIPDQSALLANVMAGGIDLTLGKNLTLEQAVEVRDHWRGGRIETVPYTAVQAFPQTLNPTPAAIADPQFRRALAHAVDRQEIADALLSGLSSVVHSYLSPNDPPEFQAMADRVVRYDYDPRRAAQMIEAMGFARGSDGAFRDERGQRMSIEIRTITSDFNAKAIIAMADHWQRVGIGAEPYVIPRQLAQDTAYRATFPGYEVVRNSADRPGLNRHRASDTPLPENNFRGNNRTRYMNPEFEALVDRYFRTIPINERAQVFGDIIHHMTDVALVLGLFYDVEPVAISNRLRNVHIGDHRESWTVVNWDVASPS
jgi:peptide/nickel transport system substrate-binding protein